MAVTLLVRSLKENSYWTQEMFHLAAVEQREDKGWLGYSLTQRDKTCYGQGVL